MVTPDTALNWAETVLNQSLNPICIPRNSYINRVFEVETTDFRRWIVKFYRSNRWSLDTIHAEHDFLNNCVDNDISVISPQSFNDTTLFTHDGLTGAIFPKMGGRVIDELDQDRWQEVGRLIGRIHCVGDSMTHVSRPEWSPATATQAQLQTLLSNAVIPETLISQFSNEVRSFIGKSTPLFDKYPRFLIHGDCHFGNILYRPDSGLIMLDFDDCVIGPAVQDLWMLLPGSHQECEQEINWFLDGYLTFNEFPLTSLALIEPLTIMRQIHFAAWCTIQHKEPHFQHHFPDWGGLSYWNQLLKDIMDYNLNVS